MKKLLLLFAVAGASFFVSCDKEPQKQNETPTLIGSWQTVRQSYSVTTTLPDEYEELKQEIEKEIDIDVSESESYRLTLNNDGTGYGSAVRHDGAGRYEFDFTWEEFVREGSEEDMFWIEETVSGYGGVFLTHDGTALERVTWKVEELSADKMTLSYFVGALVDGMDENGHMFGWSETHTYRYTFEKVE